MLDSGRTYERAFESLLRARRTPFISLTDARRSLAPAAAPFRIRRAAAPATLKSFDYVVYPPGAPALLVDVKGRAAAAPRPGAPRRLESWVTRDDLASLDHWRTLFGPGFEPAFAFLHAWTDPLHAPDPSAAFPHEGRFYTALLVRARAYAEAMRTRSPRWETVQLATDTFLRFAEPLAPPPRPAERQGPLFAGVYSRAAHA